MKTPPKSLLGLHMNFNRRQFNRIAGCSAAAWTIPPLPTAVAATTAPLETFVPYRKITAGPKHHWFGYYDKREFDPTNTLVLANEVDFEDRSPTAQDRINVGYIDTANNDQWNPIGVSGAWGWQQGCMLQWIGDRGQQILWNDRQDDRFVARIYDVRSQQIRTIGQPIYTISPDGRFGLSADFRRIDNLRPGYGYDGLPDPYVNERAPQESGVWKVDLQTGESRLILSLAEAAAIPWPGRSDGSESNAYQNAWHYFNHLLISPDASRFIVLHRFRPEFDPSTLQFQGGFVTRMLTAAVDGSDRYVLDPSGNTSHFIWNGNDAVTMWTKPQGQSAGFYDFVDQTDSVTPVGKGIMTSNGHNTYLPAPYQDWILNDTYPDADTRRQTVYLYHVPSRRRIDLGHFPSPPNYTGEWRCDTHPRSSNDGHTIAIDSPHDGGRQVHLLDIREILASI